MGGVVCYWVILCGSQNGVTQVVLGSPILRKPARVSNSFSLEVSVAHLGGCTLGPLNFLKQRPHGPKRTRVEVGPQWTSGPPWRNDADTARAKRQPPTKTCSALAGPNRQSPIPSVQRTRSTLAGHSAAPCGMNVALTHANCVIRTAAQRTQIGRY